MYIIVTLYMTKSTTIFQQLEGGRTLELTKNGIIILFLYRNLLMFANVADSYSNLLQRPFGIIFYPLKSEIFNHIQKIRNINGPDRLDLTSYLLKK